MNLVELRKKEREYDRINNEGGDGYNPYREEIRGIEREAEHSKPKTTAQRKYEILRKLQAKDCSLARECGTYNQAEIDRLRSELHALEQEETEQFLVEWTAEVTKARRAEWNQRVRSGEFGKSRVDIHKIGEAERKQGWTVSDLRRAVQLHNL